MNSFISTIPSDALAAFCHRWEIPELAVFGSALRENFNSQSDLDILVTFTPNAEWGLLDHVQMKLELESLFHRSVDLISKRAVEQSPNWIRREEIISTAQVLFSGSEAIHEPR